MGVGKVTAAHEVAPEIVRPGRIRAARDLRGLTQAQVVARMAQPITTAALSQIESGLVRPSPQTLRELGDALEVPQRFFGAEWPSASTEDMLNRVTYFRDLAATPAKERRRAAAMTLILSDLLSAIETHLQLPDLVLPESPVGPQATRDDIDDVAQSLRGEWGVTEDGPVPNVVRLLEQHGIAVARFQLGSDNVSAFSLRLSNRPLIMLSADKDNYVRARFNASHELGHLLMHKAADPKDRTIEHQANAFASSFLMPSEIAERVLPRKIDASAWSKLAELKRDWGMSLQALLFRSRELGLLTPDRYRNAMKYVSARGWRKLEPGDREMGPAEAPRLIASALSQVAAMTQLDSEHVIAQAHLPIRDTLALVQISSDSRPRLAL